MSDGNSICMYCAQVYNAALKHTCAAGEPFWSKNAELKSLRDQNSVLKWALRRALDWLAHTGAVTAVGHKEVLKILADNGLEYDGDGHLVERKAEGE